MGISVLEMWGEGTEDLCEGWLCHLVSFLPGVPSPPVPPLPFLEGSQCSGDGLSLGVMEKA